MMTDSLELRNKLHDLVSTINEEELLKLAQVLVSHSADKQPSTLSSEQLEVLESRRQAVDSGDSKVSTWDSFKTELNTTYGLQA